MGVTKDECALLYAKLREITDAAIDDGRTVEIEWGQGVIDRPSRTGEQTERCLDGAQTLTVRIGSWPVGYAWARYDDMWAAK